METLTTEVAASSPAPVFEVPTDRANYETWRKEGTVPETKPQTEKPAPSKETSAEGDKPEGKSAPASEAGNKQEQKSRSNADSRLNDLLDDLREAGLTPKALKSFKQDYQRTQQQADTAKAAPEKTANPAELKAPVKPDPKDFEGKPWTEYESAKDKYAEEMADFKVARALEAHTAKQQQEAASRELQGKLADAKARYGDDAGSTIRETSDAIFNDAKIPGVLKALVDDSPVLVDLMYTLGSKAEDLQDFLKSARSKPGEAIRKLVLIEKLVMEELAGGKSKAEATETTRSEDGKFKAAKAEPPEKKTTAAPPPPKEVSGRGSAPSDELERAVKEGDFRAFQEAGNRRDLQRRRGN